MTEPTPVPDAAGGGSRTATVPPEPVLPAPATKQASNGHRQNGAPRTEASTGETSEPGADTHVDGTPAPVPAATVTRADARSADDVEAGSVALWRSYGESNDQG